MYYNPYIPHRKYYYPHTNRKNASSNFKQTNSNSNKILNPPNNNNEKKEENIQKPNISFELFGIKLEFDDILLIILIFFLYNEGITDQLLFITLILLLLS